MTERIPPIDRPGVVWLWTRITPSVRCHRESCPMVRIGEARGFLRMDYADAMDMHKRGYSVSDCPCVGPRTRG